MQDREWKNGLGNIKKVVVLSCTYVHEKWSAYGVIDKTYTTSDKKIELSSTKLTKTRSRFMTIVTVYRPLVVMFLISSTC